MGRSHGKVVFVSRNGGMLVVQHGDGFALVELLGSEGELSLGDVVIADWDGLGGEPLFRGGERFDAYFQGTWGQWQTPVSMARNMGGG